MRWLCALALLLGTASWAEATTYYVNKSGSNSNSCTTAQSDGASAKLTIAAGLTCLSGGDTLSIGDGTYQEMLANNSIPSGSGTGAEVPGAAWPNATVITATNVPTTPVCNATKIGDLNTLIKGGCSTPTVIIKAATNCSGAAVAGRLLTMSQREYIIWQGIMLDGDYQCQIAYDMSANVAHTDDGGASTAERHRFYRSEIKSTRGCTTGCGAVVPYPYFEFVESFQHGHGDIEPYLSTVHAGSHGFYGYHKNAYYSDSVVGDIIGTGITLHKNSGVVPSGTTIRNTIIYNTITSPGFRLSGDNNTAYNNIVWDNGDFSQCINGCAGSMTSYMPIMVVLRGPSGNKVYNNTVYSSNNTQGCIGIDTAADTTEIINNICYGGLNDRIGDLGTGSVIQSNRCATGCPIAADPLFEDAVNKDFRLQATSTLRGIGTTLTEVTVDIVGVGRVAGSYDLGAFQFTAEVAGVCPAGIGLLTRYWLDEAASGQVSAVAVDTGPAPTVDLTWTYGASGQPDYTSVGTGRGAAWGTVNSTGKAEAAIDSTKVHAQLDGCKTLRVVLVVNATDVGTSGARFVQLGTGSAVAKFGVLSFSPTSIRFTLEMGGTQYSVDFPHTHTTEARTVLEFDVDTSQAVEANRVTLDRDGSPVTATGGTYPPQDATWNLGTGMVLTLGNRPDQARSPQGSIYYLEICDDPALCTDTATQATALTTLDDAVPITEGGQPRPTHRRGRLR